MEEFKAHINKAKEDAVAALREEFAGYDGYIFADYRGMTVAQITQIRKDLRKDDAAFRVVKNRYAKIALQNLEKGGAEEQMVGPTAVALVKGDTANVVAKILFAANKDGVNVQVKGALLGGEVLSAEQIEAISKLPTKLELIASLMGTMKAPVQKLAATLKALADRIDTDKMKSPSFLMVLTAVGQFAYTRKDGVLVVPIGCLKP